MKHLILATISGAVLAFTWTFVSKTLIDWHTPSSFQNPSEVQQAILANAPQHSIYMLPMEGLQTDQTPSITQGPFVYAAIRPHKLNSSWSITKHLTLTFINHLLASCIIASCVLRIRATRFISRGSVGSILGTFSAISTVLPRWIWFETPPQYLLPEMLDPIIAYTLAGIVIACIIKAPKARRIFS